jgi:hypothetical protein
MKSFSTSRSRREILAVILTSIPTTSRMALNQPVDGQEAVAANKRLDAKIANSHHLLLLRQLLVRHLTSITVHGHHYHLDHLRLFNQLGILVVLQCNMLCRHVRTRTLRICRRDHRTRAEGTKDMEDVIETREEVIKLQFMV